MTQIRTVTVLGREGGKARSPGWLTEWEMVARELPQLASLGASTGDGAPLIVSLAEWAATECDPAVLDGRLRASARAIDLHLVTGAPSDERAALEVLTRGQIFLPRPQVEDGDVLDGVLRMHRRRHDTSKPLVAADYEHALDTHRWVLRLRPAASLALQIAALFHDVERLRSEADRRIEPHATDYQAFKNAHARGSARLLEGWLRDLGLGSALVHRAAELVADHERPARNPEAQVLADADALSFFSRNCPGFIDDYGPEHTARKIAYTLRRLSAAERWRLSWIKLRADVAAILCDASAAEVRA